MQCVLTTFNVFTMACSSVLLLFLHEKLYAMNYELDRKCVDEYASWPFYNIGSLYYNNGHKYRNYPYTGRLG